MAEENGAPVKLSLKRQTEVVTLEVGEGESAMARNFTIREMSGLERDQFMDVQQKRAKFDGSGKFIGINTVLNIQADLIGRCLVDTEGAFGEAGKLVMIDKIQGWPATVQEYLHGRCEAINKLTKAAVEEVKKD